jgi:hypothetical protein
MQVKLIAKWTFLVVTVLIVIAGAVLFGIASRTPSNYRPAHLTLEEQNEQATLLGNHIAEFGNQAGAGGEFWWAITAEQANKYLASLDSIASLAYDKATTPSAEMAKLGMSDPAVAMKDGVVTVMVNYAKYKKILSADLVASFDKEGKLNFSVRQMRVGDMPLPDAVVSQHLDDARVKLMHKLSSTPDLTGAKIGPVPVEAFRGLAYKVVEMLGGKYVSPEVVWPVGAKHRVLIDQIVAQDGKLSIHSVPYNPPPK